MNSRNEHEQRCCGCVAGLAMGMVKMTVVALRRKHGEELKM